MTLAFIRARTAPSRAAASTDEAPLARTGSSSKNLILALAARGLVSRAEEWDVGAGDGSLARDGGRLPRRSFPSDPSRLAESLQRHVAFEGAPDLLWVEGTAHPAWLATVFDACPRSFTLVYSKFWKPWTVERLDRYDLCLIDDAHQEDQVHRRYPGVRCGVWDKLVDYEHLYRPLDCDKDYDVCYVAYLRPRKNHELLFRSLAKLGSPAPRSVCVGEDRKGYQADLERLASDLGLDVDFAGERDARDVNLYINRSRIGVMCSERDAAPRAILEYMAAGVPVLVNAELMAGARYVGPWAGLVRAPEKFHEGLRELLEDPGRYSPRAHYLAGFSTDQVVSRFVDTLAAAGLDLRAASTAAQHVRGDL
jgi:glycosyltransferase involved in cell wall biosynthesis